MSAPQISVLAMLFMSKASPCYKQAADGTPQLTLRAVHRINKHQTEAWTLVLTGEQAGLWWSKKEQLRPGAALCVHADRIRAHAVAGMAEIVAHVDTLSLHAGTCEVAA